MFYHYLSSFNMSFIFSFQSRMQQRFSTVLNQNVNRNEKIGTKVRNVVYTCIVCLFSIQMNGITNFYHTARFMDLTASSQMFVNNFKVIVPEKFTIPEQRAHRFVPGSQIGIVSITGKH